MELTERPKLGIIITAYNCLEYTVNAVNTIKTSYPYHLIIVDDYSTDGTKQWLRDLSKAFNEHWAAGQTGNWEGMSTLIDMPTDSLGEKWNLGCTEAKKHGCKITLICNNDILFHPATIDTLVNRWIKAKVDGERLGIVSAMNRRGDIQPADILGLAVPDHPTEAESPDFSCFLLDLGVWEEIGKFDINYKPCYFEDGDTHLAMAARDYTCICTTAAPYYHYGSITQNQIPGGLCKSPQFEKLREYFRAKWGTIPGDQLYEDATHRRVKLRPTAAVTNG